MKPEIAKQLEGILEKQQQQQRTAAAHADEQQKTHAKNIEDFDVKKAKIIKPAFQEILDMYMRKGVRLHIEEQGEHQNERGGTQSANIRINMAEAYPGAIRELRPEFRLSFEKANRSVSLFTSTGHSSGPAGSVPLDSISADWIHAAFVKYQSGS